MDLLVHMGVILNKDEALRLALEALTNAYWPTDSDLLPAHNIKECGEAITAIKAALEAKDEPVEFFDWYDNAHWGNEDFKEGCHRSWNAAIKYATQPQRKPLTDEEIDKAWRSVDYTVPWDQHRIDIARAIEAAHGIKGENT